MSKFKKVFKKIAPILPLAAAFIPGLGPLASAAIGGLSGFASGGGLKSALLGGLGGFAGAGGLGTLGTAAKAGTGILGKATSGGGAFSKALQGIGSGLSKAGTLAKGVTSLLPDAAGGVANTAIGKGLDIGNIASNVIGGIQSDRTARKAEKSQLQANQQSLSAISPFLQTGQAANTKLASLLGLDPNADKDEVLNTLRNQPSYQFQQQEGQQALDRSLGARGSVFSGRAIKEGQQFGQGLADQTYNNAVSQLAQQSGQGLNAGGAASGLYGQQGDIQANALNARNTSLSQALAGILTPRQQADLEKKKRGY